jgi:hypothetical protein
VVLAPLEASWVLPAALVACGLVFFGDSAAEGGQRKHSAETFVLNFLSLPIGGVTLLIGILDALHTGHVGIASGGGIGVGAILTGRSLREVPWTGVVSLGAAALAGWYLVQHSPWSLSLLQILAVSGVVFLLVFVVLYLIELPLRIAGLFALPRIFLIPLGAISLGLAGYVAIFGIG